MKNICAICNHGHPYNRLCIGVGMSAGICRVDTEYICKHPNLTRDVIIFKGKTSPNNCPLKAIKLTKRQQRDLLTAYDRGLEGWGNLRTGWSLHRRGLVNLAKIQLTDWTMWTITPKGIDLALKIKACV
jgi:hypothetical protein